MKVPVSVTVSASPSASWSLLRTLPKTWFGDVSSLMKALSSTASGALLSVVPLMVTSSLAVSVPPLAIAGRVGEGFAESLAVPERIHRRIAVVQGVGVAAIGIENQEAMSEGEGASARHSQRVAITSWSLLRTLPKTWFGDVSSLMKALSSTASGAWCPFGFKPA